MIILVATFILVVIGYLLICLFRSNDSENSSIPYAKHRSYPIVGHVFAFIRDRKQLLMDCHQQYGNCFKIRLFNQRFIFVLSPSDWTSITRNSLFHFPASDIATGVFDAFSYLSGEYHLLVFLILIDRYDIDLLVDHPEFDAEAHRQYTQYLQNRDGLRPTIVEFVRRLRELMQHEKSTLESKWIPIGLLELSHRMIFQPSTLALFGEIDPLSLEKDFHILDDKIHCLGSHIPRQLSSWLFPKEFKARSRLNNSWLNDLHLSRESEFMQARRILFQENSDWLTERDHGAFQTGILWASLSNTISAVFWCLVYVLQDAKVVEIIQREIETHLPYFPLDTNSDESLIEEWTPEQLDSCVYLDSVINEILRLTSTPLLVRQCQQETRITLLDGRTLTVKPGEALAHFVGATHLDPNFFPEPNKFIFDRFVGKNPESIPGFTPFGGGKSMCPGRFLAKNEMKICFAMILRYMDYKFVDTTKTIPKQKPQRIGLGVAAPIEDVPFMYRYKT
jgi:cytochrome P450